LASSFLPNAVWSGKSLNGSYPLSRIQLCFWNIKNLRSLSLLTPAHSLPLSNLLFYLRSFILLVRNIAIMAVCNLKKCKSLISAGQQSIPCHSCENIFHAKCLVYSGLVRDAIDMRSGLCYYCDECIAYETQALSIRRLTKITVTELIRSSRRNTDLLVTLESQLTTLQAKGRYFYRLSSRSHFLVTSAR